jgi:hypothetical protein
LTHFRAFKSTENRTALLKRETRFKIDTIQAGNEKSTIVLTIVLDFVRQKELVLISLLFLRALRVEAGGHREGSFTHPTFTFCCHPQMARSCGETKPIDKGRIESRWTEGRNRYGSWVISDSLDEVENFQTGKLNFKKCI